MNRLTLLACLILPALAASAQAASYATLYSFPGGSGGQYPIPGVIQDSDGNFYGITANGGTANFGAVYEVSASGTETVLHSFAGGADGEYPYSPLLLDAKGNLYGTTNSGGSSGYGVVYKINASGKETILYTFAGGTADGCNPYQGLMMDGKDNLYGTTNACGASGDGTVFELSPKGRETVLHSFAGGSDGAEPSFYGRLLRDASGTLYGVTQVGGAAGDGVLYRLDRRGREKVLHQFAGGSSDGCYASGSVTADAAGDFYGTTYACGARNYGIVWKISPKGKETILHDFAGGAADGCNTVAGVTVDSKDNLYGNTSLCGAGGAGTAWMLSRKGSLTLLHSFSGSPDGSVAYGELLRATDGTLYGTTLEGGSADYGTIWSYIPSPREIAAAG